MCSSTEDNIRSAKLGAYIQTSVLVFFLFLACGSSSNLIPIDSKENVQLGAVNHFRFTISYIKSVTIPAATNIISVHMWYNNTFQNIIKLVGTQ